MTTLSTAAWIAHDLGISTGVGGSLFGRVAMHPATRNISDREERGRVVEDAWQRFSHIQLGALGLMALTWFAGRSALSGRQVDRTARALTLTKDVCVIGTLATAIASTIAGRRMAAQQPGAPPIDETGQRLAAEAAPSAKRLNRITSASGIANLAFGAGVVATTAALAMRAGKSARWSVVARLLP